MSIFKYKEDRIPVLLFVMLSALDFAIYWNATSWWMPVLWFAMTISPRGFICARNHHHQHVLTFNQALPNRLLEVLLAFHTGVTTNTWWLHHVVGHHKNYLDQKLDESRWRADDGHTMGALEYSWSVTSTSYARAWKVGERFPQQRRLFAAMTVLQLALLSVLLWHSPYNALFIYVVAPFVSLFGTAWATWYHHAGLETDDPYEASYNITHKWYNIATGNLGYHTAHHLKHGVHWSRLPELHASIADRIPAELYRRPGMPFEWKHPQARLVDLMPEAPVSQQAPSEQALAP